MSEFRWTSHDASGVALETSEAFSSQKEAEAWMGEHWSQLLERGGESVTLTCDGEKIYRMGLREQ